MDTLSRISQSAKLAYSIDTKKRLARINRKKERKKMKKGDFVFAEYDNGEIVNGEVVQVRTFGDRILLTVHAEQGYRSIYLDKCITFDHMVSAN